MWTVKELLDFLQSNNKRGAFLYVNYLNEKQFGINIIKYLDPEKIAICYDSSYRSKSPMKVDDAISLLQQFNEIFQIPQKFDSYWQIFVRITRKLKLLAKN